MSPNMTLADAPSSSRVRVSAIRAGRNLVARLCSMGLFPGVEVRVLAAGHGGPVMVGLNRTRLAIGCGMAGKILVEPLE